MNKRIRPSLISSQLGLVVLVLGLTVLTQGGRLATSSDLNSRLSVGCSVPQVTESANASTSPVLLNKEHSSPVPSEDTGRVIVESTAGVASVSVDGEWWASVGFIYPKEVGLPPPSDAMDEIAATLSAFSECAHDNDAAGARRLFTDQGLAWLEAPGDPYAVEKSPAQWLRDPKGSGGYAIPLEIVDARQLPDGRIGIVVVDQAIGPDAYAISSLWFMIQRDRTWYIDGIVGFLFYVPHRFPEPTPTTILIPTPESNSSD